jgi:hypothetical protein
VCSLALFRRMTMQYIKTFHSHFHLSLHYSFIIPSILISPYIHSAVHAASKNNGLIDWFYGVRLSLWTAALPDILFILQMIYEHGERRWNDIDRENWGTRRKTCPSAILSTTNPTWIDPGTNSGFRGERAATNRLSHGTALKIIEQQTNKTGNKTLWRNGKERSVWN